MPEPYTPPGGKVTYTVPSLNDQADGPQAFRDFADSIPKDLSAAVPINSKSGDYTLEVSDNGSIVMVDTSGGNRTVTLPAHAAAAFPIGAVVVVGNTGTNRKGDVLIAPAAGVTIRDTTVRKVNWNKMAALVQVTQDSWIINAGTGGTTPAVPPGPPVLNSVTAGYESASLLWTAPVDDGGAEITTYLVEKSGNQTDWTIVSNVEASRTSLTVSGLAVGIPVYFRVTAYNPAGKGTPSNVAGTTPLSPWNDCTGGETWTVSGYCGANETWRIHRFTSSGTLQVNRSPKPYRVLIVGGGGGAGNGNQDRGPGGGGGGGVWANDSATISVGSQGVVVGTTAHAVPGGGSSFIGVSVGGGGRGADGDTGGSKSRGGTSGSPQNNIGGLNSSSSWDGGGGGGAGGPGGSGGDGNPGYGGPGYTSNITGANAEYGRGGQGGRGVPPRDYQDGAPGVVVIAYRIA